MNASPKATKPSVASATVLVRSDQSQPSPISPRPAVRGSASSEPGRSTNTPISTRATTTIGEVSAARQP